MSFPTFADEKGCLHPIVDCCPMVSQYEGTAERLAAGQQMVEALITRGYFFADAGAVLPLSLMQEAYHYTRVAHALPDSIKAPQVEDDALRLYYSKDELKYETETKASVESWGFSRININQVGESIPAQQNTPEELHDMDAFADRLYGAQDLLSNAVLDGLAQGLGLPADTFHRHRKGGDLGTIRFLRYPPSSSREAVAAEADVGISAHTDFELFTLMHQDRPGLQYMLPPAAGADHGAGTWIDAPVRPGQYIIIAADMLERFTNGLIRATPHRVVPTEWLRHSIIRFVAVHPDTVVAPMPSFVTTERPRAYTAVTMKEHMDTTLRNLAEGKGAWDRATNSSITATFAYPDQEADGEGGEGGCGGESAVMAGAAGRGGSKL